MISVPRRHLKKNVLRRHAYHCTEPRHYSVGAAYDFIFHSRRETFRTTEYVLFVSITPLTTNVEKTEEKVPNKLLTATYVKEFQGYSSSKPVERLYKKPKSTVE
jgi:hypothetical protein